MAEVVYSSGQNHVDLAMYLCLGS